MNGQILTILFKIQKDLAEVKKRIEQLEPVYGSNAWWEKEEAEADEALKQGRTHKVSSVSELIRQLEK